MAISELRSTTQQVPHLDYYGGKILSQPVFAPLLVGSYWETTAGKVDQKYLNKFGKSLIKGPHLEILKQYGFKKAGSLPAVRVNGWGRHRTITRTEIEKLVAGHVGTSSKTTASPETIYTVYLPPDTVLKLGNGHSSVSGVGGYHSSIDLPDGRRVYYAVIVFSKDGNGAALTNNPRDNMTITTSHEWAEAITDPDVNRGTPGWYDRNYGEVGDIPINLGLPENQIYGRLGGFAVQKEWSNYDHSPVIAPSGN